MRKLIRHVIGGGILAFLCTSGAFAQFDVDLADPLNPGGQPPRIFIGPIIGLNQNFHSGGFEVVGDQSNDCPVFESGDASGIYIGLSGELRLGEDPATSNSSLLARVMYDTRGANFEKTDTPYPFRDEDGTVRDANVNHISEITYNLMTVDIMYKLLFGESSLGIQVGPSVNVVSTLSNYQIMRMTDPSLKFDQSLEDEYPFIDGGNAILLNDGGEFADAATLRFSLKAGLIYEVQLKHFLFAPALMVPHVMYDLALTSVVTGSEWSVSSLQTGVDIRWAF